MDATAWDERYAAADLVWSAGPNQFVADHLAALPQGSALDLACGEGRNAIWLAARGWQVTALDFSAVALDKGRVLLDRLPATSGAVRWVLGDATTHDLGTERHDLVLLAYLQLPSDERVKAVRRVFAALRPGGTFFLVAHDATNLTEGTGGPQDASVLYTAEEVLGDLDGQKFEVLEAGRVERVVEAADDHGGEPARTAYDCLVRLQRTV